MSELYGLGLYTSAGLAIFGDWSPRGQAGLERGRSSAYPLKVVNTPRWVPAESNTDLTCCPSLKEILKVVIDSQRRQILTGRET
jgi:hypothetical protein